MLTYINKYIFNVSILGQMSTEKPDPDLIAKDKELLPEDDIPPSNDHLYVLLGSLFIGFWVVLCVSCALCYKCKQRRGNYSQTNYSLNCIINVDTVNYNINYN